MSFFESIFFYLLACVGIIIFSVSIGGVVRGFYDVVYPPQKLIKWGEL